MEMFCSTVVVFFLLLPLYLSPYFPCFFLLSLKFSKYFMDGGGDGRQPQKFMFFFFVIHTQTHTVNVYILFIQPFSYFRCWIEWTENGHVCKVLACFSRGKREKQKKTKMGKKNDIARLSRFTIAMLLLCVLTKIMYFFFLHISNTQKKMMRMEKRK